MIKKSSNNIENKENKAHGAKQHHFFLVKLEEVQSPILCFFCVLCDQAVDQNANGYQRYHHPMVLFFLPGLLPTLNSFELNYHDHRCSRKITLSSLTIITEIVLFFFHFLMYSCRFNLSFTFVLTNNLMMFDILFTNCILIWIIPTPFLV